MIWTDNQKRFIQSRRKKLQRLKLLDAFNKKFKCDISIGDLNKYLTANKCIGDIAEQKEVKGVIHKKIGKEKLRALHRIKYEEAHGKLNEDDIVIFLDGNNRNFDIDNLMKINYSQMRAIARRIGKRNDEFVLSEKLIAIIEFHSKTNQPTGGNRGIGDDNK